jgi:Second Messenger Oligonucleotide or Dinucleotide Synthetase domain
VALSSAYYFPEDFSDGLDEILLQICEELQLPTSRYDLAVSRYRSVGDLLETAGSPFRHLAPKIYPQGSMALGTTVRPIIGPHDLDFVLELSLAHGSTDPMQLIRALYNFLKGHGVYAPMTSLKNRCVRIEYADEFYMDVLPAGRNFAIGGTCLKVPDRGVKGWTDSDPLGFIEWFDRMCRRLLVPRILDKAAPIPTQQAVGEKETLRLVVQLIKRWRDWYYAGVEDGLIPISIVLTTLAAHTYRGERSVNQALTSVLGGIVGLIEASAGAGERYLRLMNPSNKAENLTDRWDSNQAAYEAFEEGIRDFHGQWSQLIQRGGNVSAELGMLFGEPVKAVLKKRAQRQQTLRAIGGLGVTGSGAIRLAGAGVTSIRPNTFYGDE